MTRGTARAAATAEILAWTAALLVLWLMLITTVDRWELLTAAGACVPAAVAARAARRAVTRR